MSQPCSGSRDFQVENSVYSDHYADASEDLWVIGKRHVGEAEQPLWIQDGADAPANVVDPGGEEHPAMSGSSGNHQDHPSCVD